jgi:hypothetical protein
MFRAQDCFALDQNMLLMISDQSRVGLTRASGYPPVCCSELKHGPRRQFVGALLKSSAGFLYSRNASAYNDSITHLIIATLS